MKKTILSVLLVMFVLFFSIVFVNFYFSSLCGNTIIKEIVSPNRNLKVVMFKRDCGATTGFSTQLSIIDASDNMGNESGNVYIVDGLSNKHDVKWIDDSTISIQVGEGEIYKKLTTFKKVKIIYE